MDTADKEVAELLRELPPEAQAQVRDFIVFLLGKYQDQQQASALDVLMSSRGGAFNSADEVSEYAREERDSWEG